MSIAASIRAPGRHIGAAATRVSTNEPSHSAGAPAAAISGGRALVSWGQPPAEPRLIEQTIGSPARRWPPVTTQVTGEATVEHLSNPAATGDDHGTFTTAWSAATPNPVGRLSENVSAVSGRPNRQLDSTTTTVDPDRRVTAVRTAAGGRQTVLAASTMADSCGSSSQILYATRR